jgi:hypothetical protein
MLRSTVISFSKLSTSLTVIFIFVEGGWGLGLTFSGLLFIGTILVALVEDILDELSSGVEAELVFLDGLPNKFCQKLIQIKIYCITFYTYSIDVNYFKT